MALPLSLSTTFAHNHEQLGIKKSVNCIYMAHGERQ